MIVVLINKIKYILRASVLDIGRVNTDNHQERLFYFFGHPSGGLLWLRTVYQLHKLLDVGFKSQQHSAKLTFFLSIESNFMCKLK